MATPKKKNKLSTALNSMIHCTNSTDALVTLESMELRKALSTLLVAHAVSIHNHQRVLELSKEHKGKGVSFVQYH